MALAIKFTVTLNHEVNVRRENFVEFPYAVSLSDSYWTTKLLSKLVKRYESKSAHMVKVLDTLSNLY
jgi:hypothetical protein